MGDRHELVKVDTSTDLFRSGPARRYVYCRKDGCRYYSNGIGSTFDWERRQHEGLNDTEAA